MVLPEEEKEKIEAALTRMESREVARRTKERESDALTAWKKEEAKKRGDGKKEFYLKKGSCFVPHFRRREEMTDTLRRRRRSEGGDSAGQVRGAESRQEVVAQDGGEEASKDGAAGEEAHAGEAETGVRSAALWCITGNAKVYKLRCRKRRIYEEKSNFLNPSIWEG